MAFHPFHPRIHNRLADSFRRLFAGGFIRPLQQHRELFAAETPEQIARTETVPDGDGEAAQDPVADQMAVAVVQPLEVVDIEQKKGYRLLADGGDSHHFLGLLAEGPAVEHAGQLVIGGHSLQPFIGLLAKQENKSCRANDHEQKHPQIIQMLNDSAREDIHGLITEQRSQPSNQNSRCDGAVRQSHQRQH
ncbi:hypothetical protein D3C71_1631710 [compost metagenome]